MDKKEIALLKDERSYENLGGFDSMMELATKLVKMDSKLVPFKQAGDVLIVLQAAKDFKIPITFALANIHPIQGRASAGVHLIAAQLLKAGVTYEVTEDFAPVYEYIAKGGISVTHDEFVNNRDEYHLIGAKTELADYHPTKLNVIRQKVIDHRTVIIFTRWVKQPNGEFVKMKATGRFAVTEAMTAGLIASKPDTWGKFLRAMVYTRAFTDGAHKIGDDILLGMGETSILCDTYDIPYEADADGKITVKTAKGKMVKKTEAEEVDAEVMDEE